jgi:hypothetical protein
MGIDKRKFHSKWSQIWFRAIINLSIILTDPNYVLYDGATFGQDGHNRIDIPFFFLYLLYPIELIDFFLFDLSTIISLSPLIFFFLQFLSPPNLYLWVTVWSHKMFKTQHGAWKFHWKNGCILGDLSLWSSL